MGTPIKTQMPIRICSPFTLPILTLRCLLLQQVVVSAVMQVALQQQELLQQDKLRRIISMETLDRAQPHLA